MAAAGSVRLTVNPQIMRELAYAAKHTEQLAAIVSAMKTMGPQPRVGILAKRLSEVVDVPEGDVARLLQVLLNLFYAQRNFGLSAEQTITTLTERMEEKASSKEEKEALSAWKNARSTILEAAKSIGPDHPLLMAEKAQRVVYAHQCVLSDAKLYTDIRPVFNDKADAIVEAVITHVLSLDYQDGNEERRLMITLDAADVLALHRACLRAEQKAAVAKEALKGKPWATFILHEPEAKDIEAVEGGHSREAK